MTNRAVVKGWCPAGAARDGLPPVEHALMGHRAASCAHLINESARREQTVYWDFGREALKTWTCEASQSAKRQEELRSQNSG